MSKRLVRRLLVASGFVAGAAAQCPSPASVVAPFTIPLAAGGWQVQHFGQPLQAGQLDFVVISLPAPVPLPLSAATGLLCNPVGNTPCWYAAAGGVTWFNVGPSGTTNVTVGISWPQNPALIGAMFLAHFGIAGCAGGAMPDQVVMVTGVIG